jgi:hypothetical protein
MNQQFVATVEAKHDLEEAAGRVEPEAQLTSRTVLVQISNEYCTLSGVDRIGRIDPVLS